MASKRVSWVWWALESHIIFNKTYFLFFLAKAGFLAAVLVLAAGADLATAFDFTAAFFASTGFFAAVLVLAAGADLATVFDFTAAHVIHKLSF